jgi:hypothetical protein
MVAPENRFATRLSLKKPPAAPVTATPAPAPKPQKPVEAKPRTFTVRLDRWTPCIRNSLRGFARITVMEWGLQIDGIAISQSADGRRRAMLPGRPIMDEQRNLVRDERGRPTYARTLQLVDQADADALERAILAAVAPRLDADAKAAEPALGDTACSKVASESNLPKERG